MRNKLYFYPELSSYDFGWFRLSGPGLANCLFVAARAYICAVKENGVFISPTWAKFSIGPYLRGESDKRHYVGLFKKCGVTGWRKFCLIIAAKFGFGSITKIKGLGNYFEDLREDAEIIRDYINKLILDKALNKVNREELTNSVAVHIRLGDYTSVNRIPISWYVEIINEIHKIAPDREILIFSDGTTSELSEVLRLPRTRLAYYGNAMADIVAISQCALVIASDSTFSAWGAFLGNKPVVFSKRHFPSVFSANSTPEVVLGDCTQLPVIIQSVLSEKDC